MSTWRSSLGFLTTILYISTEYVHLATYLVMWQKIFFPSFDNKWKSNNNYYLIVYDFKNYFNDLKIIFFYETKLFR